MKKATLEALEGGIRKWQRIVRSPKAKDDGYNNCPLCALFADDGGCVRCPVGINTGRSQCDAPPYQLWLRHVRYCSASTDYPLYRYPGCKTCLTLAKQELAFLESLLPKKRRKK